MDLASYDKKLHTALLIEINVHDEKHEISSRLSRVSIGGGDGKEKASACNQDGTDRRWYFWRSSPSMRVANW